MYNNFVLLCFKDNIFDILFVIFYYNIKKFLNYYLIRGNCEVFYKLCFFVFKVK